MLKETPLHAVHRAAGARMVDFGGWDMPVHYGSQIDEHHAVRADAGMFDVSHMRVVDLHGRGARDFLRYAIANNIDKLKEPGKALYSCLLTPAGTVIDDLIVYFLREDFFRLVVNAATADKDIAWLDKLVHERAPELSLTPRIDLAMIAVQGPNARAKVWRALPGSEAASAGLKPFSAAFMASPLGEVFIARTGYTGEDGFEIVVPATRAADLWQSLEAAGVKPAGLGARDTLRLEAGMNLYGQDMDETTSPLESGLALDGRSRQSARFRRQGCAWRACAATAALRAALDRQGRRAARASGRAHSARRRRDHERHVQPDPGPIDRTRAAAGWRGPGRCRQGRRPRARARGPRREASVRAERQSTCNLTLP